MSQNKPHPATDYSIDLPVHGNGFWLGSLFGKKRNGVLRIEDPFGASLVAGDPGTGKTHSLIKNVIQQTSRKGFAQFVYDCKWDELARFAYNEFRANERIYVEKYGQLPSFFHINMSDPRQSNRCNPLNPATLVDLATAIDAAKTILFNVNRSWIEKQDDFFVKSGINYLAACLWFLKQYRAGEYCTFPHLIEFASRESTEVIPLLNSVTELKELVQPFSDSLLEGAFDELISIFAPVTIALGRYRKPSFYWVMSGSDCSLEVNNPRLPAIVCLTGDMGDLYERVINSLYIWASLKACYKWDNLPATFIIDELPTVFIPKYDQFNALACATKISMWSTVLTPAFFIKKWGKDTAERVLHAFSSQFHSQMDWPDGAKQVYMSDPVQRFAVGEFECKLSPVYPATHSASFRYHFLSPDEQVNYELPVPYQHLTDGDLAANVELIVEQARSITL